MLTNLEDKKYTNSQLIGTLINYGFMPVWGTNFPVVGDKSEKRMEMELTLTLDSVLNVLPYDSEQIKYIKQCLNNPNTPVSDREMFSTDLTLNTNRPQSSSEIMDLIKDFCYDNKLGKMSTILYPDLDALIGKYLNCQYNINTFKPLEQMNSALKATFFMQNNNIGALKQVKVLQTENRIINHKLSILNEFCKYFPELDKKEITKTIASAHSETAIKFNKNLSDINNNNNRKNYVTNYAQIEKMANVTCKGR